MGTPVTLPELVAVIPGTLPAKSGGGPVGAVDVCVIMDDVEFDLAGEVGRWFTTKFAAGGGDGAAKELIESRCRCCDPLGNGDGGAN